MSAVTRILFAIEEGDPHAALPSLLHRLRNAMVLITIENRPELWLPGIVFGITDLVVTHLTLILPHLLDAGQRLQPVTHRERVDEEVVVLTGGNCLMRLRQSSAARMRRTMC